VALLGEGGMGRVFKAYDPVRDDFVALKFLHVGSRSGGLEALLEEARAQAALDHPHVVRLLEAGEIDGLAYLVLAHVDGVSLRALQGRFTLRQLVALVAGAAQGVDAIHRLGIVHRDLKPANLLVRRHAERGYEALVTDFGVARDLHHAEDPQRRVVGTPHYMSPEQARGDPGVDPRSDVYGLGASLYHLLLGAPPIPGPAGPALLARVVMEAPVHPRTLAPDFPEDLASVLLKCLAKDPGARYATALDLAADLARWQGMTDQA
jgi:serine/threonine-protein kinase